MSCFPYLYFLDLKWSICTKACLTVDFSSSPSCPRTPPIPKQLFKVVCWFLFKWHWKFRSVIVKSIFIFWETTLQGWMVGWNFRFMTTFWGIAYAVYTYAYLYIRRKWTGITVWLRRAFEVKLLCFSCLHRLYGPFKCLMLLLIV